MKEKAPIYTMGSAEPRSFSRGKRGIAGTLIFTVFDRDALLENLEEQIKGSIQRIGGEDANVGEGATSAIDDWDSQLTRMSQLNVNGNNSDAQNSNNSGRYKYDSYSNHANEITQGVAVASNPHYDDEIPPFDITISFANEYGQKAVLVIYGVEILNEGTGFSIDNVTTEKACTFVARRVEHMKAVTGKSQTSESDNPGK